MPTSWTNDPVTAGSTPIKAIHIAELRNAVNASRSVLYLPNYPFTDSTVTSGETHIKAVHFGEIRSAIQDLWFRKRLGPLPGWQVGSPASPSRTIRADDMNDLRHWMNAYENSLAGVDPQGTVSFTFDPFTGADPEIGRPARDYRLDGTRVDHVTNLQLNGRRLLIRAKVVADPWDNSIAPHYDDYASAISTWVGEGYDVGLVLTGELDAISVSHCPNESPGGTSLLTTPTSPASPIGVPTSH